MKANNLTISVPNEGCDKNCPYCISKLTGDVPIDYRLFQKNLELAANFADRADVSSVLITGKGEPLLNLDLLKLIANIFPDFPLELQTSGVNFYFKIDDGSVKDFLIEKINVVAFSIDNIKQWYALMPIMTELYNSGVVVRVTLIVTDLLPSDFDFSTAMALAKLSSVSQLSFRQVIAPKLMVEPNAEILAWINAGEHAEKYKKIKVEFMKWLHADIADVVRKLCWGPTIYNIDGLGIAFLDDCIQETNSGNDIRSLIYHQDGHLYTSWNKKGSILF